ncbi:MAG TPA: TonB family protein [Bryobacteraceae bacterium]|nr:TonB family protein [Bryobacteraceae bacterium]
MAHVEVLDEQDSWRSPLIGSIAIHAGIVVIAIAYSLYAHGPTMGSSKDLGGSAVAINPVDTIPLPPRAGIKNPLANDTNSIAPLPPPKPQPKPVAPPPPAPDAVRLKHVEKKEKPKPPREEPVQQKFRREPPREDQVYTQTPPRLISPMISSPGSGGIGVGSHSTIGTEFGWYVDIVKQRVAQHWRTGDLGLATAPIVIVQFDINRDGSINTPSVMQRSGNYALDTSTVRAILDASPFPQLPPGFSRSSATFEIWFQLQK